MTWNKDDKGGRARRKRERGSHRQADRAAGSGSTSDGSAWDASKQRADKRRKRSRLGRIILAIAAVLLVAVALLPTVVSWVAPGIIASKASAAIAGRVEVASVSLGWFGSQKVTGVRIFDDAGEQRAEIDAVAEKGLLALAFAGGDYGTIRIGGSADLSPDEQGRSFLEHTIGIEPAPPGAPEAARPTREPEGERADRPRGNRPASTPTAEPIELPPGMRASLVLENLRVTYTDPTAQSNGNERLDALRIDNLAGTVNVNTSGESNANVHASIGARRTGETIFADSGTFDLTARVDGLTDAAGRVQTGTASIEADIALAEISTALLDTLPGYTGLGEQAFGRTVKATLSARGTGADLAVTLDANAESLDAHAPLRVSLTGSKISAPEPITARLDLDRLAGLAPGDVSALRDPNADLFVQKFPEVNISITGLTAPIPQGEALDLLGAGAVVAVEIGELPVSISEPATGQKRGVTLRPGTITLDASNLAEPVRLTADMRTVVDGRDAGTLTADLTASNLLNSKGAPAAMPSLRGEVNARSLAIAAVQPIAAAAGVDLIALLGDTADLALVATPIEGGSAGGTLSTNLSIKGSAPHASIDGAFRLENNTITTTGLVATLDRLDPLLADKLAPAGVTLTEAGGAELRLSTLSVNLDELGAGDLSGVRAAVSSRLTRFAATLTETGESIETAVLDAEAVAAPLADGVKVTGNVGLRMDGNAAGTITVGITAAGLLDGAGAMRPGLPARLSGTITGEQLRTAALQPFVGTDALRLPQDIGPSIDVALTADAAPGSPAASPASSAVPPTTLTLSIASEKLNGRGAFRLASDKISTTGDGLTLTLARVGSVLERTGALGETVRLNKPGWLRLTLSNLDLPLHSDGAPAPENASANAELRVAGVVVAANNEAASFDSLTAALTLAPGSAPLLTLDGATTSGEKKGTITGKVELRNAFAATDATGTLLARPVGKIELRRIPTSIAGLAGVTLPVDGGGTIALADLATAATGPDIDLTLELGSTDAAPISATTQLRSSRTTLTGSASLRPGPGGAIELLGVDAEGSVRMTQYLARTLAKAFAPEQYHSVSLPEPGLISLSAKTDRRGVVKAETSMERTTLENLPAPDGAGGFQRLDPISLVASLDAEVPLAVLRADPGSHAVTLHALIEGDASDAPDTRALTIRADASTTLENMKPAGATAANVRIATQRTEWLDAIAGLDGLLTEAVGANIRLDASLNATAAADGSMGDGTASLEIGSPKLKTASPIKLVLSSARLVLSEPAEIDWTLTRRLAETLAPKKEGATGQLTIARDIPVILNAQELRLPLGGKPTQTRAKATLTVPDLPLQFPDGSTFAYRDLTATLITKPGANAATLIASATDPGAPEAEALGIDMTVIGLPDGTDTWTTERLALTGKAQVRAFPIRLLDAMAAGDGTLDEFLGQTLRLDADIERFPRRGGTFVFDAKTEQARTDINATVRLHPRDKKRLAVILDEPMRTVLTHFDYEVSNKSVPLLPMFARVEKVEGEHQPATVVIDRLVAPVDGDVALIIMHGRVDPGVVDFSLDQGLETILKAVGQRNAGVAGDRLEPFTIAMNKGVASFKDLAVPFGEFVFQGEGKIDLVAQTEDIVLYIPAGALASEALGSAGGLIESVTIPVRRKGPLSKKNQWKPDLSEAFKPENIIKDGLDKGLEDLIPGGLKDILPGGGGG